MSTSNVQMNLHKVRKTIMKMLNDRGYLVTDDEINMTEQQFIQQYGKDISRNNLFMVKNKLNDASDQIMVIFLVSAPGKDIGIGSIKECFKRMESDKVSRAILVVEHGLTSSAKKALELPELRMEVFLDSELLYNVTEHNLVPEHQLLTDGEKKAVLEKYGVKETQLPMLYATDPVARYYGFQRGQVVKIIRPSENAGRYITYRYVC